MYNPASPLRLAGIICFLIAILHVAIIVIGPQAYRYFGAGEDLSSLAERNSVIPPLLTAFIAGILAMFGVYAFSGIGAVSRMPQLGPVLLLIGSIFTIRGMFLPSQLYQLLARPHKAEIKEIIFSLISLITGFCFLYGTKLNWDFIFG